LQCVNKQLTLERKQAATRCALRCAVNPFLMAKGKRKNDDDREDNDGFGAHLDSAKPATKKRKSTAITDCEHVMRDHYGKVS
jgi:hypothetical protein